MERALVNTVKQLDKLTEEIVDLKDNTTTNSAPSASKTKPIENLTTTHLTALLKDKIYTRSNDRLENRVISLQQTSNGDRKYSSNDKNELNQRHNSAFFKEGSLLTKNIMTAFLI